jgi:hypothetical protein
MRCVTAVVCDLDLRVLCRSTALDEDSECHSFVLKIMMCHWTHEKEGAVRTELEDHPRIVESACCRM